MPQMKLPVLTVLLCTLFLSAGTAGAQCNLSVTNVSFGTYDVFTAMPLDSDSGRVNISCAPDVNRATVTIGASATSGNFNPRRMKHTTGSDLMDYNIYITAARTAIWGDGTGGTSVVQARRPPGKPQPWATSIGIFGRIPAGQNISAGPYTDNLTVTVTP